MSKKKKDKKKEVIEKGELKGKCLRCHKPMFKNHKSCCACNRKDRLKSKANSRGRTKNYYLGELK